MRCFESIRIAIEVGIGLAYLAAGGANSPLLQKIAAIRRHFASTMGFVFPPVRVTDNVGLRAREYHDAAQRRRSRTLRTAAAAASWRFPRRRRSRWKVSQRREPAFGLNALWVPADKTELARRSGYTVVDAINVLGTHLTELMRRNAHEIFSRQDAKAFCDRVAQDSPKTVEDLVPKLLPLIERSKSPAESAARRRADPRWRVHPGSAWRSRRKARRTQRC